ncbi:MAG: lysophospholipid acyltransferase family protein [Micromonosporaceae bacterium]
MGDTWQPPLLWRILLAVATFVVPLFCRFRVVDDTPESLRGAAVIFASNHIGTFDPIAVTAACRRRGIAPRILATGGLFRTPVVGAVLRRCGHIQVNRAEASAVQALNNAVSAVRGGASVLGYPEGRIGLDPGMWPERARTGMARLALRTGAAVVPVSQWGSHEVIPYDGPGAMVARLISSLWRRPVVTVRFGAPVDLSGLVSDVPGDAQRASTRIMGAITDGLRPLRAAEPRLPRYVDPTRPVSTARTFRSAATQAR